MIDVALICPLVLCLACLAIVVRELLCAWSSCRRVVSVSEHSPKMIIALWLRAASSGWGVITFAFVGYGLHAIGLVLYILAFLMDRHILYHNTGRVVTRRGERPTQSLNDYRRGTNRHAGQNFDYRREFYVRAEQNYRGGSSGARQARGRGRAQGHVRDLGTGATARQREAARAESSSSRTPLLSPVGSRRTTIQ